jgi:hypothetical protein
MMMVNLIEDYESEYRISVIEWVLSILNLVLLAGFVVWSVWDR